MAVTPRAPHGGASPPLVAGADSRLAVEVEVRWGGARAEVDGIRRPVAGRLLTVTHRGHYATLVRLADEESRLAGLRRRGLVVDSPRVLVEDARPKPS